MVEISFPPCSKPRGYLIGKTFIQNAHIKHITSEDNFQVLQPVHLVPGVPGTRFSQFHLRRRIPAAMPKLAVLNEAEEEIPEGANSAEVVVGIADMIGIDIVNEPQFLWIAEEASRAHIPPDWKELTNEDGEVLYYHTQERKLQKVHPLILRYQEVYFKARSYTKQLESGQIGNLLEQTDAKMASHHCFCDGPSIKRLASSHSRSS